MAPDRTTPEDRRSPRTPDARSGGPRSARPNGRPASAPPWLEIDASIRERADRLIRFRRRLHATPEPAFEELATTALVAETLREAGLKPRIMRDDVGVIVDLDLGAPRESRIALRAELDCVRINDDKQAPYASTQPGLCHACGHDVHTTIILAAALLIHEQREHLRDIEFKHNLRFIFQPAEETATGARAMIKQGAIDGVEAIIATHVDPFLDTGTVGLRAGPLTAACKSFRVTIKGRSGHTARPFEAVDPIPAATNMVSLFYQLAPRSIDTRYPLALSVASIQSGSAFNAIPDEAQITGTLRTARVEDMERVQQRMDAVVRGIRESTGCEAALEFLHYTPSTDNHPVIVERLANVAAQILGAEGIRWLEVPSMGGEDFAFFQELIPGAMIRLGAGLGGGRPRRPLHSSQFDIDEQAILIGARLMTRSALDLAVDFIPQRP